MTKLEKLLYWQDHNIEITYEHKKKFSKVHIICKDKQYNEDFKISTDIELDGDDIEKIDVLDEEGAKDVVYFYVTWTVRQLERWIGYCLPTKISEDIIEELRWNGNINKTVFNQLS